MGMTSPPKPPTPLGAVRWRPQHVDMKGVVQSVAGQSAAVGARAKRWRVIITPLKPKRSSERSVGAPNHADVKRVVRSLARQSAAEGGGAKR